MADINKRFIFLQIAVWVLIYLVIFWVLWSEGVAYSLWIASGLAILLAAIFYGHLFLLKRHYANHHYGKYAIGVIAIGMIAPVLFMIIFKGGLKWHDALTYHGIPSIVLTVFALVCGAITYGIQEWFLKTLRKKEFEQQQASAELLYLKSQINPHFLFNTLNNLHGLALKQAPETSQSILHLANMMRYMLYESNTRLVPLTREIEYLNNFIELQQLRYKEKEILSFEIQGDYDQHHVAPLLFIQLIENAYKHSPRLLRSGDIQLKLIVTERDVHFYLQNPIASGLASPIENGDKGVGLSNVRKRLSLLYPNGRHRFEIMRTENIFSINLILNNTRTTS